MNRIHIYRQLNVIYPEKQVFFRLGGNLHKTDIDAEQKLFFDTHAAKAFALCQPQGRWMIKRVSSNKDGVITFDDSNILQGKKFADSVSGAAFIWFAAVTVGKEVVDVRDACTDIAAAAVYDAVAGEVADAAMDMVQKMASAELMRQRFMLSKSRYSPGYGDMSLDCQTTFFELLDMQDMNLTLTDNYFMIPEKSVTALAAVCV